MMSKLSVLFFCMVLCCAQGGMAQGNFDLHLDSTRLLTPKPVAPAGPKPKEVRRADSMLNWTANVSFTWDDFWGKPDPKSASPVSSTPGLSYIEKPDPYTGQPITIVCAFNRYKSWKNPKKGLTTKLLIHEKVHFNIYELYARKIRSECSRVDKSSPNAKAEMIAIFNRLVVEAKKFNVDYDVATDYSNKEDKQTEWNMKVSAMMSDLVLFASREQL